MPHPDNVHMISPCMHADKHVTVITHVYLPLTTVQSNLAKGRISILSHLVMVNGLVQP